MLFEVWSHEQFPLVPVGKMVLNRNPRNYFAEVEQSAFSPAHVVPGIEFSPDKMLQGKNYKPLLLDTRDNCVVEQKILKIKKKRFFFQYRVSIGVLGVQI
jgi:hypothetical protein